MIVDLVIEEGATQLLQTKRNKYDELTVYVNHN
jgi:hypothetical protein